MARIHGKDVDVAFDSVQLEDEARSVTLAFEVEEEDVSEYRDSWQVWAPGMPTAILEIEGNLDPAAGQGDATMFGAIGIAGKPWDFEPDGTTGYNGMGNLTRYSITAPVDGAVTYSLSVRHNGQAAGGDGLGPIRA